MLSFQLSTSQKQRSVLCPLCFISGVWYLLLSVLRIPSLWGIFRGKLVRQFSISEPSHFLAKYLHLFLLSFKAGIKGGHFLFI